MTNTTPTILVPPPDRAGPGNGEDIREVKPPVAIPSIWSWLGPVLIGLAVALALWLLARAWRRWRGRAAAVPIIVIPPHVRARERLREALGLIGQPKPFCIAISHGLRVYLEERFQLRAPERTTEEFLDELQASPRLSRRQKESLGDFLERCDLVKFARHEPAEPALRELFEAALRLVDETAAPSEGAEAGTDAEPAAVGDER
jgi:hypothetical protein